MEFFKKRSTAWMMFAMTVAICLMVGMSNKPKTDGSSIQTLPSGVYVQDNANILSDSTEKYITQVNNGLASRVNAEVQVITIDTANGENLFDMAFDYADDLNLSGNCAVFIVSVDDIDAVIVQGQDLYNAPKGMFTDDNLSALLQYNFTVEDFEKRNLDADIRNTFDDLIGYYASYYNTDIPMMDNIQRVRSNSTSSDLIVMITLFVIFMIVVLIICAMLSRPRRRRVIRPVVTTNRGYYPRGNTYNTYNTSSRNSSSHRGGSFSSSSRSGGFSSSSRGGGFSSSSRSSSSSFSSRSSSSSRSGGFSSGSSSRGGGFSGGSRGGGFRK